MNHEMEKKRIASLPLQSSSSGIVKPSAVAAATIIYTLTHCLLCHRACYGKLSPHRISAHLVWRRGQQQHLCHVCYGHVETLASLILLPLVNENGDTFFKPERPNRTLPFHMEPCIYQWTSRFDVLPPPLNNAAPLPSVKRNSVGRQTPSIRISGPVMNVVTRSVATVNT